MGSKTQTSTSQQSTAPTNLAGLQSISNQVQSAASTPYTPYSGELTAGINSQQSAGINTINQGANSAQPYYQQAGQLASGAANPLTASQIAQYQNPYTQSVVNATQAQFNDVNGQQQNSLKGSAAQQGALGGDRQAVAQSQLAGQQQLAQAPVIAGLYSNSYNSGLQTAAQQFQQNPLAASSALSGIGTSTENAALAGGNAQLAAGTQQQTTQQAADTANYNQYLAQQAAPYQNAAFAEQYGLPADLAQGSSSSGTQTTPGPSVLGQIAGLGIAGAGVATKFAADGGRINAFASGGSPGYINSPLGYIDSSAGYIPTGKGAAGSTSLNAPALKFAAQQQTNMQPVTSAISGLPSLKGPAYGGGNALTDSYGGSSSDPLPGLDKSDYGPGYKIGGLVDAIHSIHRTIRRSRGGSVGSPFQAYADGGDTSFADRFAPATDNPFGDLSRGQAIQLLNQSRDGTTAPSSIGGNDPAPAAPPANADVINPDDPVRLDPQADQAWRNGVDTPNPALVADANGSPPNPMQVQPALPPQITNPGNVPNAQPSSAMAFDSTGQNPMSAAPPQDSSAQPQSNSPFHISDKASNALIAAGLGMLASRSPFAGVALGEGGLQGLKNYSDQTKSEQEAADKAVTQKQNQQRIDQEAVRLHQSLKDSLRTAASAPLIAGPDGKMTINTAYIAEKQAEADLDKAPAGYRYKADGKTLESITGGPTDPATIHAQADAKRTANAVLDDDTIHDMADQYLAGDRSVMQNLGRGAQGSENIVKLRQAIAKQARESGVDPKGIVNAFNEQAGALAGQRTVGARAANISLAANEANNMIPIALAASDKLPRTQFMPWNEMVQAVQKGTSSPELASFVAATNSLVNSYVRAVSPSGVPTDSMREHAYSMLNAAQGPEAYKAVVSTMRQEMQAALSAPGQVKAELRKGNDATAAGSSTGNPPAADPAASAAPKVGDTMMFKQGVGRWNGKAWEPVS